MILFSDCMSHTLTILDDIEMYEKHKPFALGNFVTLSTVINQFLFKAIWSNLILDTGSPLFISLHSLLRYVQFLSHFIYFVLVCSSRQYTWKKEGCWVLTQSKAEFLNLLG